MHALCCWSGTSHAMHARTPCTYSRLRRLGACAQAERADRERQAKLSKGGAAPSSSASYRELQRAAAVSGAPSADGNGSTEMLRGDWVCPGCGAMCFANRTACYKCGTAGGNARPGDWVCGPCGASVFACKDSCYKCGAVKGTEGPGAGARPKKEWAPTVANGLQSNLKDTSATCRDCGAGFIVTAGEQDFFKSKGFDVCVPSRCKPCTAAKKARYGDRYGAVPDATGRASTSDSGRCRNCGQVGHMAWACTAPKKSEACYHCGKQGHMSRACPDAKSATACFHCGKEGHISRNCPTAKGGGLQCFNCGKSGHLARDCTEARQER